MEPIECREPPNPNCEVIVQEGLPWETRLLKGNMVYAYHNGYLWPQRERQKYYKFRFLPMEVVRVWPKFEDSGEGMKK